jgi:hypothetical protein
MTLPYWAEFGHDFVDRFGPDNWLCIDCGEHTGSEYYAVPNEVWPDVDGRVCIGCLEGRLGRRLTPDDFPICRANDPWWRKSSRLLDRMTYGV